MPVAESLRYGVLGLIVPGPTYAYAIAEEVRRWPMDPAVAPARRNVYHAVNWLVTEGFAAQIEEAERERATAGSAALAVAGTSAAPRKLVAVTAAGQQAFDQWMASPLRTFEELLWRLGTAQRDQLPVLAGVLRAAERDAYTTLGTLPGVDVGRLPVAWTASTRFSLFHLLLNRHLSSQGTLYGDFARLLLELHAETQADGERS